MRAARVVLRAFLAVAVFLGAIPPALAAVESLPGPSTFRPLLADPREAQYVIRYLAGSERARGEVAFGDTFGLVRVGGETSLQWGLQASVYTRFNRDIDSFGFLDLNSADYAVVLPFDIHSGSLDVRLGIGHLSSHLGESEVQRRLIALQNQFLFFDRRFLYRRDFVEGLLSHDLNQAVRVYGGGSYALHVTPNHPRGMAQLGAEVTSRPQSWGALSRQWYLAADLQAWAETDWGLSSNVQAGVRLSDGGAPRRLRVALEVYNGRVLQRILAGQHERYVSVGLYFEM